MDKNAFIIHITVEVVVIACVSIYMNSKIKEQRLELEKVKKQIEILHGYVSTHETILSPMIQQQRNLMTGYAMKEQPIPEPEEEEKPKAKPKPEKKNKLSEEKIEEIKAKAAKERLAREMQERKEIEAQEKAKKETPPETKEDSDSEDEEEADVKSEVEALKQEIHHD